MSVVKSRRGESDMEFLHNARQLRIYTIRKCTNFPKRYTFYVSQPLVNTAAKVHDNVERANHIIPTNRQQAELRMDYFSVAQWELDSLVSQLGIAAELFGIPPETMEQWIGMIDLEKRLIRGVVSRDKVRYKNLF